MSLPQFRQRLRTAENNFVAPSVPTKLPAKTVEVGRCWVKDDIVPLLANPFLYPSRPTPTPLAHLHADHLLRSAGLHPDADRKSVV